MNRIIFHLPFRPDRNRASASQIRPFKMMEAFKSLGFQVDTIMGCGKERKRQIKKIKNNIKCNVAYEFLYSESSTMPTLLTESHHLPMYPLLDFGFFKFCKRNGIPIGLFYRDIHWRFQHYINKVPLIKRFYTGFFYKFDLNTYNKVVDVIYLPSMAMKDYLPELKVRNFEPLPPGTEEKAILAPRSTSGKVKILYVGGIGELYNLELFLDTLARSNDDRISCTVCCRKEDFESEKDKYFRFVGCKNVVFVHEKGQKLAELYNSHDICCLFVKPEPYWDFAMPVKLFEYISFQKPILCVRGTNTGRFVENEGIGWALPFDERHLSCWLKDIISYPGHTQFDVNLEAASLKHRWDQRALKVQQTLQSEI